MAAANEMTIAQIQAEIGRLQMMLAAKVLGDPRQSVTVHAAPQTVWRAPCSPT